MADRSRTYLSTDWSIQTFVPEAGSFILNFSELDGSDVLGTTSGSYETLHAGIVSLSLTEGGTPNSGLIFELLPTTLVATLQFTDFQMSDVNKFYVGAGVRLLLENENTYADATYGNSTPVFIGVIDGVNVDLVPGQDFAQLTFTANYFTAELNSLVTVYKSTTSTRLASLNSGLGEITNVEYALDWPVSPTYNYATNTNETKTYGEFIADLIAGDVSVPQLSFYVRNANEATGAMTYDFSPVMHYNKVGTSLKTFTGSDLSDIVVGWSGQDAPTGVTLYLYSNDTIIYQYGSSDSITDGNTRSLTSTVDVKDLTQLTAVGQTYLSMTPEFSPISITTETATQYQTITFREQDDYFISGNKCWVLPTTLFNIGDTITVDVTEHGINQDMIITGRTLEVSPDNWMTTYNLWKGL